MAVNHFPDSKSDDQFKSMKEEAGAGAKLIAVPGDIAKPETGTDFVSKTVSEFGRLDVFVSNAGVCQFAEFLRWVCTLQAKAVMLSDQLSVV